MKQSHKKSDFASQNTVYVCRAPQTNLQFGEKIAAQHRFALQVLHRAYLEVVDWNLDELHLHRLPNGKYVCDKGHFSISHSGNYVAVAVSNAPIGVDIQKYNGEKVLDVAKKFFTEAEKRQLAKSDNKVDCFYLTWCKKEALWKSLATQPLTIATVETCEAPFTTRILILDGETYYLAVTGNAIITIDAPFDC